MKKVLVFGGSGMVGSRFISLHTSSYNISAPDATKVDILNKEQVIKTINEVDPDSIINFAAYTNVEEAEKQKQQKDGICFRVNAIGAKNIAEACLELDKKLIHISTEYVFNGAKAESPYTENDKPDPINWYGYTKYAGEQFVLASGCKLVLVRICMPFSPHYDLKLDIARFFVNKLKNLQELNAITDQKITPTYTDDIVYALRNLLDSTNEGIYHICSKNSTTPYDFAKKIAQVFTLDFALIKKISLKEYNDVKSAKLLQNSWLDCTKFVKEFGSESLHTIEESIEKFKQAIDGNNLN